MNSRLALAYMVLICASSLGCLSNGDDDSPAGGGCEYMGEVYEDGETFPDADGCNSCNCNPSGDAPGSVECTLRACVGRDCDRCSDDELCVVTFGGACDELSTSCVADTTCSTECNPACDTELCFSPTTCDAPDCGLLPEGVFGCYGP